MKDLVQENQPRPVTPLGIVVEQLQKTLEKLRSASNISPEIVASLQKTYRIASGLDPYIEKYSSQESAALAELAHKTAAEPWHLRFSDGETVRQLEQEMLSGHLEGQTLKMFVRIMGAKRVLEVGMFTGYSALAMAEALPEDGRLVACEVDDYVAKFAQDCFRQSPHGGKITVEVGPALETLQKLAQSGASFDLVFIDADKTEYIDYLKLLLEQKLLAPNGLICVDNTLLQGQPYLPTEERSPNGEAIARFNRFVAEDSSLEQVILPLRDGLTMISRKN